MSAHKGELERVENGEKSQALLSAAAPAPPASSGTSTTVKMSLLAALVLQNATLNVAARRSRVEAELMEKETGCGFRSTTAVVVIEVAKIIMATLLLTAERFDEHGFNPASALMSLVRVTLQHPLECAKILVPAFLYTLQNNLLLVAADNLEGPVLALFSQIKILTTALFSVLVLGRALGSRRWCSLFVLTLAIAIVQVSQMHPHAASSSSSSEHGSSSGGGSSSSSSSESTAQQAGDEGSKNMALGLTVSAMVSTVSGFSGVYFELVLKSSPISVWIRNIHLAAFSSIVATGAVYSADAAHVHKCGFLGGYGPAVWTYVAVQAAGGLLIAAVIKYADNILKAFATSVAIVLVSVVSAVFYHFELTGLFFAGAGGVIYSVFLYGDLLKDLPFCSACPAFLGGQTDTKQTS